MSDAFDNLRNALEQLWQSIYEWATTPLLMGLPFWKLFLIGEGVGFLVIGMLKLMGISV